MTNPTAALRAALAASPTHGPLASGPCVLACYTIATRQGADELGLDYVSIADALGVTIEYIEGVAAGWDAAYVHPSPPENDLSGESRDYLRGFGTGFMLAREAQQL